MKWCFNVCLAALILLTNKEVSARDVVLVESQAGLESGLMVKKILMGKFQFPEKLIRLRITNSSCEKNSEAIVHLCLLASGDLQVMKMNEYVVKNSFGIFMNGQREEKKGGSNE